MIAKKFRMRWAMPFVLAAVSLGAAVGLHAKMSYGTGNTVVSSLSPYTAGTATVGTADWHGGGVGEDAIDLFVPRYSDGKFAFAASNQYLYWESSNYGSEGGGTSTCTGKVYQIWYSNGGVWTAAILQNIVHLQNKAASSYGSSNPYSTWVYFAGQVADSQSCGYDTYHFHDSRNIYWGNSAHNIAATAGSSVPAWTVVLSGRD